MQANCPVCASKNTRLFSSYKNSGGNFLNASSVRECQVCSLVFAYPLPTDEVLDAYYGESVYYNDKTPYEGEFYDFSYQLALSRMRLILKYLPKDSGKRWLDVGAGNAVLGIALKELEPEAVYDAVEPSVDIRQGWGNWVSDASDNLSTVPIESYDVITLNQVLEHVNRPLQLLKDLTERLLPGGLIFIDVPYRDDQFKPTFEPHLLFWSEDSLTYAINRVGLKLQFCDSVGMPWVQARRYFEPQLIDRIIDPWRWILRMNKVFAIMGINHHISTFPRFQANRYGGDRQWLRCLAQKLD